MNSNVTPPQNNADARARSAEYAKRRKIVKIILIVFAVIIVLYLATMALDPNELVDRWFSGDDASDLPPQNIEFSWSSEEAVLGYTLTIATDENFTKNVAVCSNVVGDAVLIENPHTNCEYFWKINGVLWGQNF